MPSMWSRQLSRCRWIAISERDANLRGFAAIILTSRPEVAIHPVGGKLQWLGYVAGAIFETGEFF